MGAAIVTGAGQGIGEAIALRLAQDGFDIAINDISAALESAQAVAEKCRAHGVKAECFFADVSSYDECEKMVKEIEKTFGGIDVLVNNAGITRDGLMARMSEENYDKVIAVNQKSVFNMMKFCGTTMMRQRSGRIINISSVAGVHGNMGQINYSASKAAVIGMSKSAAKELGRRGITVNAIAPGFISTAMTDALTDEQKKTMLELTALRRYGTPQEVAGTVSFLAGKDGAYITGQVIEISGGLTI
ncbi:MAG: 3-oxoacyl-[acyl-carrier-protein] reductase [Oscillospiraceae bacterium]|nr:3-oxoacyl-[acyl-carrier-protein] reductase [Oscillospiraceae bacterium]